MKIPSKKGYFCILAGVRKGQNKMVNAKIMIVDDDKIFLEELQSLLDLSGYELTAVNDSLKAVERALEIMPDIILLDLKMTGLNGFQVAQRLRKQSQLSGVDIIAMSGCFCREEDAAAFNVSGVRKWLKKPFNPLDVISLIEETLTLRKGEANG